MAPELTVLVPGQVGLGLVARPRLPGFVGRHDPELIPLALAQTWNASFQFLDGGGAIVVIGDQCVEPTAEFVFLLNNVVTNGSSTSVFGFGPT